MNQRRYDSLFDTVNDQIKEIHAFYRVNLLEKEHQVRKSIDGLRDKKIERKWKDFKLRYCLDLG